LCPPYHLVLDLYPIARVEEIALGEQFVGNALGMKVQSAVLAEGLALEVDLP
jgi:hypothetical protein